MTFVDGLIMFFVILSLMGVVWGAWALVIFLYGRLEAFFVKRRVPEKLRKEVEDERHRRETRREEARRRYAGEATPVPAPGINLGPEVNELLGSPPDAEVSIEPRPNNGGTELDNRSPERRRRRIPRV